MNAPSTLYYGYRYYNPVVGRWISRDPAAVRVDRNLYRFCRNDALNRLDVLGLFAPAGSDIGVPDAAPPWFIVEIARKMQLMGWEVGMSFQDLWRGGSAYVLRPGAKTRVAGEPFQIVDVNWALRFERDSYDRFFHTERIWDNDRGRNRLVEHLRRQGVLANGGTFDHISGAVPEEDPNNLWYNNSREQNHYQYDDLTAAIGDFEWRSVVAGCVHKVPNSSLRVISIWEFGGFIKDKFEFGTPDEFLGFWHKYLPQVSYAWAMFVNRSDWYTVTNETYRQYRGLTGNGRDFWVFSSVKRETPDQFVSFVVNQ